MYRRVGSNAAALAAVATFTILCLPGIAAAVTVGASIGTSAPQPGQCFSTYNTGVQNTCSSGARFEIPLVVNQGPKTVNVEVLNSRQNDNTFQCTLYAATQAGALIAGSMKTAPYNNTGTPTVLSLSVTVPYAGVAYVYCNVNPQGIIRTVTYSH